MRPRGRDNQPDNRVLALEGLWYSAVDGLDTDGIITEALRYITGETDPNIAAFAEQALERLEEMRKLPEGEDRTLPEIVGHQFRPGEAQTN